jgi:hypothetical protein
MALLTADLEIGYPEVPRISPIVFGLKLDPVGPMAAGANNATARKKVRGQNAP